MAERCAGRILVVDDEPDILDLAAMYLEGADFEVLRASTGQQALQSIANHHPDLVVLDVMLPELDGWEVCRRIRAAGALPVIMVTARGDPMDRVVGLDLGADDYVVKPFHGRELVARVRAVLRRSREQVANVQEAEGPLMVGDLILDSARRAVSINGNAIEMRAREFELLKYLCQYAGLVRSRDQLLEQVWGYDFLGDSRTVDVHISHVRAYLANSHSVRIDTVWGIGYKLVTDPPHHA